MHHNTSIKRSEIAIIGLAGRFPGAGSVDEFWGNLRGGVESISFFSAADLRSCGVSLTTLHDPAYVKAGAVLDDVELFDAAFFGMSAREAEITDPQHRLFLECAGEALKNSGYDSQKHDASVGVFAGAGMNTYLLNNLAPNRALMESLDSYQIIIGNEKDYLATRVSYKLNLRGPSVTVQTACSTSLVAVHLACQSLRDGECDIALAGGVSVRVPQKAGYFYRPGGIGSSDGHTRAFDAGTPGTLFGSGLGIVVLKPLASALADGDHIHAVIKGSAINNDGNSKLGYTAPSMDGQMQVITQALAAAGVEPETISYVEAHGTGTILGDPVELGALMKVFGKRPAHKQRCAIGTVKTNVGHLDTAAGITGLIKAVLSLEHKELPPSLHFERPNPAIDFSSGPFFVQRELSEWQADGDPRRAAVTSLGFGGTNAHVVLEEAPTLEANSTLEGSGSSHRRQLLLLSAKTPSALDTATMNLAEHLKRHPDLNLADVAYTLQTGRREFGCRRMVVCQSLPDAVAALQSLDSKRVLSGGVANRNEAAQPAIAFMFPGHGSQHVNMMRELYETEPDFRSDIDTCAQIIEPYLGFDLRHFLYPDASEEENVARQFHQTLIVQPALFVTSYALAKQWMRWGIEPEAMIGYSIGEYVAACLAGVFSLPDALLLVAARARLIQSRPAGSMLAVPLTERQIEPLLGKGLSLAAVSGPAHCIVAGVAELVDALKDKLTQQGVYCRGLHVSHAFHSDMLDPILEEYREAVTKVSLQPPALRFVSSVTGAWAKSEEMTDPDYWVRELRNAVRFSEGISELAKNPKRIFLEAGPSQALTALVRGHPDVSVEQIVLSSCYHPKTPQSDVEFLLTTLGKLWLAGAPIAWSDFYPGRCRRLPLPAYPFERQRYWIDAIQVPQQDFWQAEPENQRIEGAGKKLALIDWGAAPVEADSATSPPAHQAAQPRRPRFQISASHGAPTNSLEQKLADLCGQLLGMSEVGIHDDFFELGGNSLIAVRLISQVRESFAAEVPLGDFL